MVITPDEYNLFRSELLINYSVFVDNGNRKANFTDGKFAEMLNSIKEYGQKGYINSANPAYLDTLSREGMVNYILAMGSVKAIYTSTAMDWFLRSMISEDF